MGFLTDPETGKRMTPEKLIARETKEWGQALGVFFKECVGAKKNEHILLAPHRELQELLNDHRKKKRR